VKVRYYVCTYSDCRAVTREEYVEKLRKVLEVLREGLQKCRVAFVKAFHVKSAPPRDVVVKVFVPYFDGMIAFFERRYHEMIDPEPVAGIWPFRISVYYRRLIYVHRVQNELEVYLYLLPEEIFRGVAVFEIEKPDRFYDEDEDED